MLLTDIVTEYGAYYRKQGQNAQRLYQLSRRAVESEAIFTPIITDETIWHAGKVTFGRLVQGLSERLHANQPACLQSSGHYDVPPESGYFGNSARSGSDLAGFSIGR